ncbi:MAG: ABC transporter permease [Gemmatimonadota bacterium]|nr:ABC transporter permease [Gemmatimonadota bacterium]
MRVIDRVSGSFARIGERGYFAADIVRALPDWRTYGVETVRQMRNIGVGSVPLTVIVAAFIGAVTAFQTRYQLFGGVQLSVVGLISRQSIILELGPLLTALVLTGRVGARITAELGTMRVTEQIDALTALGTEPVQYLMVPRVAASIMMMPLLVIMGDAVGIFGGYLVAVKLLGVNPVRYVENSFQFLHLGDDIVSGLIKAAVFGLIFSLIACVRGYYTSGGAEGVGKSTTRAVVSGSLSVLFADFFLTKLLF